LSEIEKSENYIVDKNGIKGAEYGDGTFVSWEDMVKQVSSVIQKGYGEEWNGCMRSGKCCSFFMISLNEELYSKMHNDIRELWLAHYGADNVKNLPNVELPINHVCSKLRTQYTKEGQVETMCSEYDNRPSICRNFTCNASKVRKQIMKDMLDSM